MGDSLTRRAEAPELRALIIATNPGMESDATEIYVEGSLAGRGLRITRLARGLPVGGDLECVDPVTMSSALLGRSERGWPAPLPGKSRCPHH
ncbi:MAG: hypothetical protein OXB89_11695 [Anaerolineaceae bacterium]|nr:hypothetical protein [Anaerolineaceae bacterium]